MYYNFKYICLLVSYNYILFLKEIILEFILLYLLAIIGMCFLLNSGDFLIVFYLLNL
jgi:NADH:ubiquinone oxidoreductase subunit 2 (subunit N)